MARDDDEPAPFVEEPRRALLREVEYHVRVAPTVGRSAGVAEIDEVMIRQRCHERVQHGQTATEFSFFLAIPIMFAATGYDLLNSWDLLNGTDFPMFIVGFITAFLSALLVIKVLIRFVANHDFIGFAWYRIIFGSIVLLYYL